MRVFESILHSGARGYSKVYAEERLLPEPFMLFFAGSNPAVCNYSISPVDWFVLRDEKDDAHELVGERTFSVQVFVIIRQSEKCFGTSCGAM